MVLPIEAGIDLPFNIAGKTPAKGDYNGDEQWRSVSPHYFQVFKISLLRGRVFSETDAGNSSRVVIINEAMAKRYWKSEDPVGQVITIGKGLGPQFDDPPRQIIGIVGTVRENGLKKADTGVMYIPQSQVPEGLTTLANSVIAAIVGGSHGGGANEDAQFRWSRSYGRWTGRFPFRASGRWNKWLPIRFPGRVSTCCC